MNPQPLVSCIMPTHNRRAFVPQAIAQFLRQDYPHRELIILDDGTDPVADLIPDAPHIRYEQLPAKASTGAKRNRCCQLAAGTVLLHWDDDDWMADWRIRYQVEQLLAANADLSGTDRLYFYEPTRAQAWEYCYPTSGRRWVVGGTLCYTKAFWQAHPFPDKQIGEDSAFVWADTRATIAVLPRHDFYVARIHAQNTSPKRVSGSRWHTYPSENIHALLAAWQGDGAQVPLPTPPATTNGDPAAVPTQATPAAHRAIQVGNSPAPRDAAETDGATTPASAPPSVIVSLPYFRAKPYIARAVESILAQSYPHLTLVVVNDGDEEPPWPAL
ncbi:MAG: glycosyltransferase, partial [Caldilineaceae bacterium]|nr:glycosyltransferase [Caldilineaceae bacterium]